VESASLAGTVPFGMTSFGHGIRPAGSDAADQRSLVYCQSNIVDENYFRTMGIGLLRGRSFLPAEGGSRTAVAIDPLAARRADRPPAGRPSLAGWRCPRQTHPDGRGGGWKAKRDGGCRKRGECAGAHRWRK